MVEVGVGGWGGDGCDVELGDGVIEVSYDVTGPVLLARVEVDEWSVFEDKVGDEEEFVFGFCFGDETGAEFGASLFFLVVAPARQGVPVWAFEVAVFCVVAGSQYASTAPIFLDAEFEAWSWFRSEFLCLGLPIVFPRFLADGDGFFTVWSDNAVPFTPILSCI